VWIVGRILPCFNRGTLYCGNLTQYRICFDHTFFLQSVARLSLYQPCVLGTCGIKYRIRDANVKLLHPPLPHAVCSRYYVFSVDVTNIWEEIPKNWFLYDVSCTDNAAGWESYLVRNVTDAGFFVFLWMIERILQPTGTERRIESKVWLFIALDPLPAFRQPVWNPLATLCNVRLYTKSSYVLPTQCIYVFFCGWPNKQQLFPFTVCF